MSALRTRSFWLHAVLLAYVGSAVLASTDASPAAWGSLGLALGLLAWVHDRTESDELSSEGLVAARAAVRTATTGGLAAVYAALAPRTPGMAAGLALGATMSTAAGTYALLRVAKLPGLLARSERDPSLAPVYLVACVGAIGTLVEAAWGLGWASPSADDPRVEALVLVIPPLLGLTVLLTAAARGLRTRALTLGAPERLRTAAWLAGTTVAGLAAAVLGGLAPVDRAAPLGAVAVGVLASLAAATREPDRVARAVGTLVAALVFAGGPAIAGASFARATPARAAEIALASAAAAALGGLLAPWIGTRLGTSREPFADALRAADRAATVSDPDVGLERALDELRRLAAHRLEAPCIFRADPASVITVDIAGYLHVERAELPGSVVAAAREEPEQVLRLEVLRAAETRRPELRAAVTWMSDRRLSAVALLLDEEHPSGLLGVPAGQREEPWSLAEVRALRGLADRLAALVATSSRLSRALAREAAQRHEATLASVRARDLEGDLADERQRVEDLLRLLERRARVACYAPASRLTMDRLEELARAGAPLALLSPPGVDALAWVATWHLASPRRGTSLVVVDGQRAELADLELWRDEARSPLARARGRTLVLFDPQALPRLVQAFVAASLDERIQAAVVVPKTIDVLVASDQLDEGLADVLGDRTVAIPPLSERAEDLRALALDHLARIGARLGRGPMGLDPRAMAMLAEHAWTGNDVELEAVLLRAAVDAAGATVGAAELERAGLSRPTTSASTSKATSKAAKART